MPRNANQSKQSNYSMDFDSASSNYIDCGNDSSLDITGALTISFWIYGQTNATHNGVITKTPNTTSISSSAQYHIQFQSSNQLRFVVTGCDLKAGTETTGTVPTVDVDSWQHFTMTWNGSNEMIVYKNGIEVATKTQSTTIVSNTSDLIIGHRLGYGYLDGKIDAVAIFDYALSASQVTTLWGGGTSVSNPMALPSPPIAYYPLGGSAAAFRTPVNTGDQWLIENNAIGDYVFDFSSDVINTNSLGISGANSRTISCWFNADSTSNQNIIGFGAASQGNYFTIAIYNSNIFAHTWNQGGVGGDLFGSAVTAGKWHLAVMTYDGTNLKISLNGGTYATTTASLNTTNSIFKIGSSYYTAWNLFSGKISNTKVWNTDLSQAEVETLYNYGSPIRTLANIPQSSNLKAWYKLDASEVYNNTSTEWSIDNNQNPSAYSSSLDFDSASSDYIDLGDLSNIGISNASAVSVSLWFNKNANGNYLLFDLLEGSSRIALQSYQANRLYIYINNRNYNVSTTAANGDWHNIILVFDGSGAANADKLKLYFNGSNITGGTYSGNVPASVGAFTSSMTSNIGRTPSTAYFNGSMSNASIWNTALTSTQVTELYNSGTPSNLSSHSATSNLISWWKLNNTTTGIEDSKGSNNGTNNGATEYTGFVNTLVGESSGMTQANLVQSDLSFTSGYSPYALDFDGTNDYIDCGDSDDFSFGDGSTDSPFSVSAWVNPDAVEYAGIVAKYVTGGWEWLLYLLDNNFLKFLLLNNNTSGNSIALTTDVAIPINTWTHVSATYNANGEPNGIDLYINGSLQSLVTESTSGTYQAMTNTTAPLQIGTWNGNFRPINGQISNVSIWDVKLTPTQVSEIYNEGVPQNLLNHSAVSSLVSWWQLGSNSSFDGNDWIVADEKGTNNGTSVSMPVGALTNGVGTTANGVSSGMSEGNLVGDAPYSTANALSTNMVITSRVSGVSDAAITTGGTGYVTGTNIATTGGSGTNCTINITTVSGGVITAITINNGGSNYVIGDVLTISGGNGNATITVSGLNTP